MTHDLLGEVMRRLDFGVVNLGFGIERQRPEINAVKTERLTQMKCEFICLLSLQAEI
jgi:hypothetical protein